jgi:hypothetical protein
MKTKSVLKIFRGRISKRISIFLCLLFLNLTFINTVHADCVTGWPTYIQSGGTWGITPQGVPIPPNPIMLSLAPEEIYDNAIYFSVNSSFNWTFVTFTNIEFPSLGTKLFADGLLADRRFAGCASFEYSTPCCKITSDAVGIYTIEASNALPDYTTRTATGYILIGGGSRVALQGTQLYRVSGNSDGVGYSYGVSLNNANPVMVVGNPLPVGSSASAFASAFAAGISANFPGFLATATGATFSINTVPPGTTPFRFWIGDALGVPQCQVTGGICSFNPTVTYYDTETFTFTNNTSIARSDLHITVSDIAGGVTATVITNAPGCDNPTVSTPSSDYNIDVVWSGPCVDDGESVTIQFIQTISPIPISYIDAAYWTPDDGIFGFDYATYAITYIPTLSQWGIIIFTLLLLAVGMVFVQRRQFAVAVVPTGRDLCYAPTGDGKLFDRSLYIKVLGVVLLLAVTGLALSYWHFGTLSKTDSFGTLASSGIVAYMVHFWMMMRRK